MEYVANNTKQGHGQKEETLCYCFMFDTNMFI